MPRDAISMATLQMLAMDVDGVLTDGGLLIGSELEIKRFHAHDGLGLQLLHGSGIALVWITGRVSDAVTRRARELACVEVLQGVRDKAAALSDAAKRRGIQLQHVGYVGDDINDLAPMRVAGSTFAPADCAEAVRAMAGYLCRNRGGHGAVREICELILRERGELDAAIERYIAELLVNTPLEPPVREPP